MTKAARQALGRRGRRNRPPVVSTADYYDDFYGFGDTTLSGRLPLLRPAISSQVWSIVAGGTAVMAGGRLEGRFASQNNVIAYMDYDTDDATGYIEFEFGLTGTLRSASVIMRLQDSSNYWHAQAHLDQSTWRIIQVTAGSASNRATGTYTFSTGVRYGISFLCEDDHFEATLYTVVGATRTPVTPLTGTNPLLHSAVTPDTGRELHGFRLSNSVGAGARMYVHKFEGTPLVAPYDVEVTIDSEVLMTSKFMPGVSFVKNPVYFNTDGWDNAKVALGNSVGAFNMHMMNFGMADPWTLTDPVDWENGVDTVPAPATPNRLTGANNRVSGAIAKMQEIRDTNATAEFIFTIYNIPWWQKGILQNNAVSLYPIPIAASPDYDSFTDKGRPVYQNLEYMRLLIKEAAKIVMVEPYNVRWFQVWNEAKGFFNNRNDISQKYEMDFLTGNTANGKAELGYGYVYIECVRALFDACAELDPPIDPAELRIGGPYTNMRTNGNKSSETLPSTGYSLLYDRPYGTWKKAATQGIETFLDGIEAAVTAAIADERLPEGTTVDDIFHFLCFDFGPSNTDGVYLTADPWVTVTKYTDLMEWAQAELDAHGWGSKPIVGSEVYKYIPNINLNTADPSLLLAFATEVYRRLLLGGLTYPLAWGSDSEASDTSNTADWMTTSPLTAPGGTQLEWGEINGLFKDEFGPGTEIFEVTSSDGSLSGIASATKVLLLNKTGSTLIVRVEGENVTFTPYEVKGIDR